MTEHDLSTLVRDHVSSDEPPRRPRRDRRRRPRRPHRRLAAGVGVAAVLAVAGALVVPQLGDGTDGAEPGASTPPSSGPSTTTTPRRCRR